MQKWEYKTLKLSVEQKKEREGGFFSLGYSQDLKEGSDTELVNLGDEGWELVSVMPIDTPGIVSGTRNAIAFFKRPRK